MKKILTILMLCGFVYGYAQNTPPHAASTKTWTFGEQTWSDAIHIPECNKEEFTKSTIDPQCRSYTKDGKTWYYYNWAYVQKNQSKMCPPPWRVPTKSDSETLASNTTLSALSSVWGYGGYADGSSIVNENLYADYWSSTENGSSAYYLGYYSGGLLVYSFDKYNGFQVRCVR
ncbi:MAG: fibrobacter succinogenes major paralogous domain-containing protein [Prevotellaceae bacterium]|nr:fibrobacter succinogenes major paralogous domain-containing protein [Prevotellaceae bacterium]